MAELVDGAYQTGVSKTTFNLDGALRPILYVSGGRSSIIIPYGIQSDSHRRNEAAFVYNAGSAPGFTSAVSQVNVQIPPNAPPGQVEVRLVSGTTSTQDGVTIFVQ